MGSMAVAMAMGVANDEKSATTMSSSSSRGREHMGGVRSFVTNGGKKKKAKREMSWRDVVKNHQFEGKRKAHIIDDSEEKRFMLTFLICASLPF